MLAARLKTVLGKLVSVNQYAFVAGRNILDGVFLINEILDMARREKRRCVTLKVDFEKEFLQETCLS